MLFQLMFLSIWIPITCVASLPYFSNFPNTFAKEINKEAPYIGKNYASY